MPASNPKSTGGRHVAKPTRKYKKYRPQISVGLQWVISIAMMAVLFLIYFVLCLLLTKYNLFALSKPVRLLMLGALTLVFALLALIMTLYGDWRRPLCALLACLAIYIPANYTKIPKVQYYRTWLVQTAYSTMRHQGLMHFVLPWVAEEEVDAYKAVLTDQIGVQSTDPPAEEDQGHQVVDPVDNSEFQAIIEDQDPGVKELPEDQKAFYTVFYEIDRASMEAYVEAHPEVVANGWDHIFINKSSLSNPGTGIYTRDGEEVLSIDYENKILILQMTIHDTRSDSDSRAVLAIAKDPSMLHLIAATTLPSMGQRAGKIASANGGILAMTGSSFLDEGGNGYGGQIAGFARCGGKDYGTHFGYGHKRLELHENNRFYIKDAPTKVSSEVTDCMEFQPALVVNGQAMDVGAWVDTNPRACIGQSKYDEILMLVVEGRFNDSPGCSLKECIPVLLRHNCETAMNCDGGTTAIMWYRGEPIMRCSNTATPEGRYLPNAWVIVGN